jgi:ABC-type transport system involved in cytochrome bd biosynthesis fused ATPase/permease subunit
VTPTLSMTIPMLLDWAVDGVAAALAGALALPLVTALLASALGPRVLLALALAGMAGAAVTLAVSRRLASAWALSWDRTRLVLRGVGSCYDGAVELRAHDRAAAISDQLRRELDAWSTADARARLLQATSSWGALGATLLAGLGAATLLLPETEAAASAVSPSADPYRAGLLVLASIPTLQMLLSGVIHLSRGRESLRAVARQLDLARTAGDADPKAALTSANDDVPAVDAKAEIRFEAATFSYPGASQPAVCDRSFALPRGASMTIVGKNGAGKTTLVYLLLGILEAERGRVTVGGIAVRGDRAIWRRRVAYLSQRPFELRDGTVAENMRALEPELTDADLRRGLERIGLWSKLRSRVESDAAVLAIPYAALSRGESRRVLLARTLLRDADLLVLDEPETNLDPASVAELAALLREEAKRRRVVAVVHDPQLIGWADLHLVLGENDPC